MASLYDWIDERTGVRRIWRALRDEPIRGGARFAYAFGSALVFLFSLQAVTGILLAMYYVPSADHAHASVAYVQKVVPVGSIIRGLHSHGASALIIILIAHLVQTYLFGAYKKPRELVWVVGLMMMPIILGLAFTGSLLPWDQEAYFGAKVGIAIIGEVPVVGPFLQRLALGGHDLTTLTLSRFFAAHVFLLPLALALLMALHLYLFRKAGAAGPPHHQDDVRVEPFYPYQLFKDMVVIVVVFFGLLILAVLVPARLGPQADPTSDYLARPPWYFLPLFQLLKYFPGKLALIPTVGLPTILFGMLFLLPFLDRHPERHPLRRPLAIGALALGLGSSIALGIASIYQDVTHPEFRAKLRAQDEEATAFLKAPFVPQEVSIGPDRPIESTERELVRPRGVESALAPPPAAFTTHCAFCHGPRGEGNIGPRLIGITEKPQRRPEDLMQLLLDPRRYGLKDPMPARFPTLSDEERKQIVEWLSKAK